RPGWTPVPAGCSRCAPSTTWSRGPPARPSSAPTSPSGSPRRPGYRWPARGREYCGREQTMSVTAPEGFTAAGGSAGIKDGGVPDVAVVVIEDGGAVPAAGVFTANLAAAAPVQVSRAHLLETGGHAAGVILTSGNANAATGEPGRAAASRLCHAVGRGIGADPSEILVCQTGLIGIPFPITSVEPHLDAIVASRRDDAEAGAAAARAIMTTDTKPKTAFIGADGFSVGAMAKGAAMLAPNMATMLALCTTDAAVNPVTLRSALQAAVQGSFNLM